MYCNALRHAEDGAATSRNEESAVYVGLRDFLKSMSADRKRVLRRHGHLSLRLSYETP